MILAGVVAGCPTVEGAFARCCGHAPGAGVDGHGICSLAVTEVDTVAITQSERTLGCCAS